MLWIRTNSVFNNKEIILIAIKKLHSNNNIVIQPRKELHHKLVKKFIIDRYWKK